MDLLTFCFTCGSLRLFRGAGVFYHGSCRSVYGFLHFILSGCPPQQCWESKTRSRGMYIRLPRPPPRVPSLDSNAPHEAIFFLFLKQGCFFFLLRFLRPPLYLSPPPTSLTLSVFRHFYFFAEAHRNIRLTAVFFCLFDFCLFSKVPLCCAAFRTPCPPPDCAVLTNWPDSPVVATSPPTAFFVSFSDVSPP